MRGFVRKGREAASMMMVMMAALDARRSSGKVKRNSRPTGGPAGRALIMATTMMARVMIDKVSAIKGRPLPSRDSGMGLGMMMLMQLMAFKTPIIRGVLLMGRLMLPSAGPSCLGTRHTDALPALSAPEAGASATG